MERVTIILVLSDRELQYALLVSFKTITQSTWGVYRQQNYLLLPPLDQQLKLQQNARF